jgi:hypothetical protein
VLLFNPMTYTIHVQQVIREGICSAETLVIFACLIGLHMHRESSLPCLSLWAIGLGTALGAFWMTREDGIWLVPSVALLLTYTAVTLLWHRPVRWASRLMCCATRLAVWGTLVAVVCTLNWANYGIYTTCEFRWPKFVAAYSALSRVTHHPWRQCHLLPRETRQRIYAISPAFRELEPGLEGEVGKPWASSEQSCRDNDVESMGEDLDFMGSRFWWAFRDAVAGTGYYRSGKTAAEFYGRLASEVNHACDAGLLEAGPKRNTMAPPWRSEYCASLLATCLRGLHQVISPEDFSPDPLCSSGPEQSLAFFRQVTNERLSPLAELSAVWPNRLDRWKLSALRAVGAVYQKVMPWAGLLAGSVFLCAAGASLWRRQFSYYLILEVALVVGIVGRIGMLSMTEVCGLAPLNGLYLTSVFPLLLLSVALPLMGAFNWVWRRPMAGA